MTRRHLLARSKVRSKGSKMVQEALVTLGVLLVLLPNNLAKAKVAGKAASHRDVWS
jgi:hypothetical protein